MLLNANAVDLVLLALAAWRLAYLLAREDAPWGIMKWTRERLGGALTCLYCSSVWAALIVLGLWHLAPLAVWVLGVSGGALMLHRYTGGDHAS